MLRKEDVKYTIGMLAAAGKRIPRNFDGGQQDPDIVIDLWYHVFRDVDLPIWQKAARKALTMTDARGLDLNVINTALMEEALQRTRQEEREKELKEHKQLKSADILAEGAKNARTREMKLSLKWTIKKRARRESFNVPILEDHEVMNLAKELGLTAAETEKQGILLRMYVADLRYCRERDKKINYEIYLDGEREIQYRPTAGYGKEAAWWTGNRA